MQPRMQHPALLIPASFEHLQGLGQAGGASLPAALRQLVHMRVSQINGCSFCVDMGVCEMQKAGETAQRMGAVAAWRDAPFFTPAERAALALAEAVTRLADRSDPVPDALWEEAKQQFSEVELGALLLHISATNVWNRLNVATRQVAGRMPKAPAAA